MKRSLSLTVAVLALCILAGCDDSTPVDDPLAQLMRANVELQRQIEAQQTILRTMGIALVLMGGGLAVTVAALWRRGGRSSATTTERTAAN